MCLNIFTRANNVLKNIADWSIIVSASSARTGVMFGSFRFSRLNISGKIFSLRSIVVLHVLTTSWTRNRKRYQQRLSYLLHLRKTLDQFFKRKTPCLRALYGPRSYCGTVHDPVQFGRGMGINRKRAGSPSRSQYHVQFQYWVLHILLFKAVVVYK